MALPPYHYTRGRGLGVSVPRVQPEFVYALVDPRDNAVRYIGVSCDPIRRLKGHMEDVSSYLAQMRRGYVHRHSWAGRKARWLLDLRNAGLRPRVAVIEDLGYPDLDGSRETHWIAAWERSGASLLNVIPPHWRSTV